MLKLGDAADALGVTRRELQEFLDNCPADLEGVPFFAKIDGARVFTPEAVERLRKALKVAHD